MLSAYRVLDLADDRGLIAGMILADLGADVIAVEPPAGNPARRRGPFVGDAAGIERALTWQAPNATASSACSGKCRAISR